MKPLQSYSRRKFLALSPNGRIKVLRKLVKDLVDAPPGARQSDLLSRRIALCLDWMGDAAPADLSALFASEKADEDSRVVCESCLAYLAKEGLSFKDYQLSVRVGDGRRDTDPELLGRSHHVIAILDNLRSAFNVGSIFRSAECLQLKELWFCGVTATPESPALRKTAMGTDGLVPWRHYPSTLEALDQAHGEGYASAAIETAEGAVSLYKARFTYPLALVVGNESLGIPPKVLAGCGQIIRLPVLGWKNSLNVAAAFTVCAYQAVCGPAAKEGA